MGATRAAPTLQGPALVVGLGASGASVLRHLTRHGVDCDATDSRAAPPQFDALRAQLPQMRFVVGGFAGARPLSHYRSAVLSPGVALDDPFVAQLRAAGVKIIGDIELFARAAAVPVIGITGSNGKSTVTTLVGAMAHAAGLRVAVGGNLGLPALDLLAPEVELYVLELSSFQLETTSSLVLTAATILNLSPDHLDRHGSMDAYRAAKARIYRHAGIAIVNRDDDATRSGAGAQLSFGLDAPHPLAQSGPDVSEARYGVWRDRDGAPWLAAPEPLLPLSELRIHGLHNAANALAALALADAAGIPRSASCAALRAFRGLPHRCEWVAEVGGIGWINDSKGTNVGATLAALEGLDGPLVWLGGGQAKGQDFTRLRPPLAEKGRAAVLFGADAARIESDLAAALPVRRVGDLRAAVQAARQLALPGDQVLLSPACASLDQFRNYEERGTRFRALVQELETGAPA